MVHSIASNLCIPTFGSLCTHTHTRARAHTYTHIASNYSAPTGRNLVSFDIWGFLEKSGQKMEVLLKSDNNNEHTTWTWAGGWVGIATDYGLDGPGLNPGGDEIFPPVQTGSGAHPASCKMGTGSLPGVKCGRSVLLIPHPLLVPRSWKSRAIPLPTTHPLDHTGPVTGSLYISICW